MGPRFCTREKFPVTTGLSLTTIAPADIKSHTANNYQPIFDFDAYLDEQRTELDLLQYTAAKTHKRAGTYGLLKAGNNQIENGWLHSDFPLSLNWYWHETTAQGGGYFSPMGHFLYHQSAVMRMAGRPGSFGLTSPATSATEFPSGCPIAFPTPFPFTQRCLSKSHMRLLVHDILSSGNFHIGYHKVVGGFATYGTQGTQDLIGEMQYLKSIRDTKLRFTTPYQRVHVHLDAARFDSVGSDPIAKVVVQKLESLHAPYSMFRNERVLSKRMFPKNMLRRGTVLVPFHKDLTANNFALYQSYRALAASPSPRPAVGVFVDLASAITLNSGGQLAGLTYIGMIGTSTWAFQDLANLFFVFVVRDPTTAAKIGSVIDAVLLTNPTEPTRVFNTNPAQVPGSRVHVNFVSDGLNFFAALSNRDLTNGATVTSLTIHNDVVARFGSSVSSWVPDAAGPYFLAARETKFIYFRAVVPGSYTNANIRRELTRLQGQLDARNGDNFDTADGQQLLNYATTIHDTGNFPERVIAAILRLRKMIFLNVNRTGANLTIHAKRIAGPVITGAPIQILHLVNGHFEQDAGTTAALPVTVQIGASTTPRWDFYNLQWSVPPQNAATDPVEVHVADPTNGVQAFVTR